VWGNAFHTKGTSLFEGPKLCFNQGYIAAMPPDELAAELSSGRFRKDESQRIVYGNMSFSPPQACIAEIMHYWRFMDEARRIASRRGAVLYHAYMETPFVQLKETEFDKVDGSTAREAIYADAFCSDDFKTIHSRWVAEYRKQCFGMESISPPPLAQCVLSNTGFHREETVYEVVDSLQHDFRTAMLDRKLHCLPDGVMTTRRKLQAFRKINTESLATIAELRVSGRADLKKYARAKERFVAALNQSREGKGSVRNIFSFSSAVEFLGQTLIGNYPKVLLDVAKKLAEFLPLSNELHFGSANMLYDIANVLEHPVRSFREVFGELSSQANDDLPHFLNRNTRPVR
jgi:hypothetical protein